MHENYLPLLYYVTMKMKIKKALWREVTHIIIVQFQKISILPHRRDWNFLVGRGCLRPKHSILIGMYQTCYYWNFQRGGESWKKSLL